jgi:hypothetical protein
LQLTGLPADVSVVLAPSAVGAAERANRAWDKNGSVMHSPKLSLNFKDKKGGSL